MLVERGVIAHPCCHVEACRSLHRRAPTCIAGPARPRQPEPSAAAPIQASPGGAKPCLACLAVPCRSFPGRAMPLHIVPRRALPSLPCPAMPCAPCRSEPCQACRALPGRARPSAAAPHLACQSVPDSFHHAISNKPKPRPADCFESGRPSPMPTCSPTRVIRLAMSSAVSIPAS